MLVTFKDVTVLSVHNGVSKKGNAFSRLSFLDGENLDVYDVFVWGDAAESIAGLEPKSHINAISFQLQPDRSGGVRLVPAW